ncbi:glycosyltransferase [Advenella sp. WQ 585]|uniref:Glycosyltransferase n=1 Tax=Advenella mandrilli TaxID=2800330 RepID=A0ABS1ECX3_9BURK|nr:glycosyltransferase [Advenella mandrilli]MBK1781747.1 glycosyltransferase [Advenella mandrilli]
MQRILHIIGKMDRAGAETMLMNIYRHIDRTQIQFDFVTFTNQPGDYDTEIIQLGGRIIPIIAKNSIQRMFKLRQFLKSHQEYQIVHAHILLSNAFHLIAAKQAGVKYRISHSHNASDGYRGIIVKLYEKWSINKNKKLATHKIACGKEAAKFLFKDSKDVILLPNAVDIHKMIMTAEQNRNYIQEKFSDTSLKIIQVGRMLSVKNHQFSLEIAQALKKRNINFTMYFIGNGVLLNELKQQTEKKSLSDCVKFLGLRTDVAELMASADYMIMPSLHEGFPVVLVESQTVGLHSLVSDQVSQEVDLGVNLVKFLPINSVNAWVENLLMTTTQKYSTEQRVNELKEKKFDVAENSNMLMSIYKLMQ